MPTFHRRECPLCKLFMPETTQGLCGCAPRATRLSFSSKKKEDKETIVLQDPSPKETVQEKPKEKGGHNDRRERSSGGCPGDRRALYRLWSPASPPKLR
ncbi:hypothetical protein [Pandoravirus japonicus]|uniref:Uncharacterized protein n=1 Tax=Pandoravirus japonicus TaxID=2823154 RepID=A0A811BQ65_9VIRU|nr:hypothetical protein [Pandoravirus japonicus]